MTVEIGVFLLGAHGPAGTVGYARAAEEAGLGAVWLAEHHFISYGQCPSATVLAAHLLAATSRIAVGTAACVLSDRHPVALGEEAALLAALAPGRFRLGVGRGGPWVDLEVFGTGLPRYERGFPETLDLLLAWLSGAPRVGAAGEFFRFREVTVVPRPAAGAVPVWVAATSPSTVEIAARRGLPLLLGVHEDEAAKAATLRRYAGMAAAAGHDPAAVPHASAHLAGADEVTLRALLARTQEYVRVDGSVPRQLDSYVDDLLRIHRADAVDSAARLGVRHLLVLVEAAAEPREVIRLLGQRAAPTPDPGGGTRSRPGSALPA